VSFKSRLSVNDLTIGDVSRMAAVPASTLRYYESVGLLSPAERVNGRRRYDGGVLQRLEMIGVAQEAGFTIAEIRTLFRGFSRETPPSARWKAMARRKLPEVEALIGRAEAMRRWLDLASICDCESLDVCALFDEHALPAAPLR
jgi:MerR family redox-sensitive transcriptional activator SoxR